MVVGRGEKKSMEKKGDMLNRCMHLVLTDRRVVVCTIHAIRTFKLIQLKMVQASH